MVDRCHTVAIDYPGFGLSDLPPESPTFDRLAEITASVIDALGIGDYALEADAIAAAVEGVMTATFSGQR